jgi:hypothetical protein
MEQGNIVFQVKREEISDEAIKRCKDLRSAIRLCIEVSGIAPKEVAFALNIDSGHFSRMISTTDDPRHFPPERMNDLMNICINEIPLRWQAMHRGYGLFRLQTELEMENDRLRKELEEKDREHAIMLKVFRELKG